MQKNILMVGSLLMALITACTKPVTNTTNYQNLSLEKKWETEATLLTPESVLYDRENNVLYVSNINGKAGEKDGNGSIARVSLAGKVEQAEWAQGLDAPKGMGLYKGLLYVADLTKVVVIDTKTGQRVQYFEVPGAEFLNDITIDNQGQVYVSDSNGKKIFKITANTARLWFDSELLKRPNGLLAHQNKLYLIDMETGIFYQIDPITKAMTKIAEGLAGGDGIVPVGNGDFLISNWNGEINYVGENGQVQKLLDTKEAKINAADIDFIPGQNILLVPTFFANKIVAYQLKR